MLVFFLRQVVGDIFFFIFKYKEPCYSFLLDCIIFGVFLCRNNYFETGEKPWLIILHLATRVEIQFMIYARNISWPNIGPLPMLDPELDVVAYHIKSNSDVNVSRTFEYQVPRQKGKLGRTNLAHSPKLHSIFAVGAA